MTSFQELTFAELLSDAEIFVDGDWVESKDQDPDGDVRLIQLADIGDGFYIDKSSRFLNSDTAKRLKCTYLKEGDVLVARMPDPLGRACIFPKHDMPCVTVVDVCIIRPNLKKIDNKWLMYSINSPIIRRQINEYITGTTRQRISRGNLSKIKISVPPLAEQRRIASVLDKADELRKKRQQAIEKLDQLLHATFIDMFGDPVSNPKGWKLGVLGDLGTLDRGISKHRPRGAPELLGGSHPLIQTGDVARSLGYIRSYVSTYSDLGLAQSKKWPKGTLCITIAANIANTGILTFEACFPDSIVGFTANKSSNVEFVQGLFFFFKQILEEKAPQSAQKNINLAILRELEVPIPPMRLQEKWSKIALSIEDQKQKLYKQLDIENQLFSSLQNQAFNGTL
ncbi:restriction endonuclease subunit S [Acinetobacter baumannii]|nr:restriction endonuclease subunit S [Acinetobacter baumannii]